MNEPKQAMEQALEALQLGRDAVYEQAREYHVKMAGYRPHAHQQADEDVAKMDAAITALRAALSSLPDVQPVAFLRLEADDNESASYQAYSHPVCGSFPVFAAFAPKEPGRTDGVKACDGGQAK